MEAPEDPPTQRRGHYHLGLTGNAGIHKSGSRRMSTPKNWIAETESAPIDPMVQLRDSRVATMQVELSDHGARITELERENMLLELKMSRMMLLLEQMRATLLRVQQGELAAEDALSAIVQLQLTS